MEIFDWVSLEGDIGRMNPLHTVIRLSKAFAARYRNVVYRLLGVRMRGYVWLRRVSIPRQWSDITLERRVALDDGVVLLCSGAAKPNKLVIGEGTYINRNTILDAHEHVEVGRHCMIGPGCYLTDGDHGTLPGKRIGGQPMKTAPVVLEDSVWLGAGVIVLKGVRFARGAIVGVRRAAEVPRRGSQASRLGPRLWAWRESA